MYRRNLGLGATNIRKKAKNKRKFRGTNLSKKHPKRRHFKRPKTHLQFQFILPVPQCPLNYNYHLGAQQKKKNYIIGAYTYTKKAREKERKTGKERVRKREK
jgi:hypothetical protein